MIYLLTISVILGLWVAPFTPKLYTQAPRVSTEALAVLPTPTPDVDKLVDMSAKKYGKTRYQSNRIKALLHFLLLREQNYGGSTNCGDGGKACGPLQYHAPTYTSYRAIMMKRGLVDDMGSRLDMEDAIETTAWAISDGRENAWGPVARNEIKL